MIEIISKDKMQEIIRNPLLDINKGKYTVIDDDQFICVDNSSGSAYQKIFISIIDVVKWFNGMLT